MDAELVPVRLTGRLAHVTELGVVLELKGRMGMLHLPMRSVIADKKPEVGDTAEIFISYARLCDNQ